MKIDDKYDGFKSFDELVSESKNLNQTNRTNFAFSQNNFDDRKETLQNHKHKKTQNTSSFKKSSRFCPFQRKKKTKILVPSFVN